MLRPITNISTKIFVKGFYKAHAGLFLLLLFILTAPGAGALKFHQLLMLYFIAKPLAMFIGFGVILIYTFKCWHFVSSTISAVHQQFLFYSMTSYSKSEQLLCWIIVQALISLPTLLYMLCSIISAISHQYFLSAFLISIYLIGLLLLSAFFYDWRINKLIDGSKPSKIHHLTYSLKKPFFSLYIYHVLDNLKLKYALIKLLSYLLITGVFLLFADVKTDVRVAGIAMLAIAMAHAMLIFEERKFDGTFLTFARTLPMPRFKLYLSQICMYSLLLLPEAIWLLFNLPVIVSFGLFLFCLSIMMLFVSTLHLIGCNQERYLQIVFWLFFVIFFLILYKLIWPLMLINFLGSYAMFYFNYYKFNTNPMYDD